MKTQLLFLQFGLPSTPIRHENETFRNALRSGGLMCDLMWTGKDFENCELINNPKSPNGWCDCCLFKLLCASVNRKHLICFCSQSTVFKFLWHRGDPVKTLNSFLTFSGVVWSEYNKRTVQSQNTIFKYFCRGVD